VTRGTDDHLAEAADAAAEIVMLGKERWDALRDDIPAMALAIQRWQQSKA
jgi:hypothetical protein